MIINRTPYRISFFGGGTDYPAWFEKNGGGVLACTINKYCYLTCRHLPPFFEHKYRLVYSKSENCKLIDDIQHPVVREALRLLAIEEGIELHHDGDLPARSGMGSSSAFTVGLLMILNALKGKIISKKDVATLAIELEQKILNENVGCQDQILTSYGGLNYVTFYPGNIFKVEPITISSERQLALSENLMLFYSGIQRISSLVAGQYVNNLSSKEKHLHILKDLAQEGLEIFRGNNDFDDFGKLLHEAWKSKRSISSSISNGIIDEIYDDAISAGAYGGKLLGAGGGGFMLFYVPKQNQKSVRNRLKKLTHVPFEFENFGSQIIFYERD